MNEKIRNFIRENENLIEDNEWDKFYERAFSVFYPHVGELTQTLQKASIDPLEYLDHIPEGYLSNANIESFIVPNHIKNIGAGAFARCGDLVEITIPDSIISIRHNAFYNCTGLTSILFKGTVNQWTAISKRGFWNYGVPANCKVICIDSEVDI